MTKAKKKKKITKKKKKSETKSKDVIIQQKINDASELNKKAASKLEGQYAKMGKAYQASAKILKAKMKKERAEDLKLLETAHDDTIAIVKGVYDKIETVMDLLGLDYILLEGQAVGRIEFRADQLLIVNCPGNQIDKEGIEEIRRFVEMGGFLLTTDWAILHILEKAFPGYVKYTGKATRDDVVSIEVVDKSHPFLMGLFADKSNPQWWLEGSSYPIQILKKYQNEIKILVKSAELKKKYGEEPVVITFNYGKGTILHMISHYYLQRSELRDARHKKSGKAYAEEMALSKDLKKSELEELEGVPLGEVESAYTSAQFISNIIVAKQKQNISQKMSQTSKKVNAPTKKEEKKTKAKKKKKSKKSKKKK